MIASAFPVTTAFYRGQRRPLLSTDADLPDFATAFQPIVDLESGAVLGYEALARTPYNESASHVFESVPKGRRFRFDRLLQQSAVRASVACGLLAQEGSLFININTNSACDHASSVLRTCAQAEAAGIPPQRLVLEFVEDDAICNFGRLMDVIRRVRSRGVRIAIDDFGAGYSGLKLLMQLRPDIVKVDRALVAEVDRDRTTQIILRAVVQACLELNIDVIAEGVEQKETAAYLRKIGIFRQQGYLFAQPGLNHLPTVSFEAPELPVPRTVLFPRWRESVSGE